MDLIKFTDITFSYESQTENILENINFEISSGNKVGLIGKNGCGKTTILKLIKNEIKPISGHIFFRKNLKFGILPQELRFKSNISVADFFWGINPTLADLKRKFENIDNLDEKEIVKIVSAFEKNGGYNFEVEVEKQIGKFKFDKEILDREISKLSGGEKTKIALCRIILTKPDILLMDEPTNHLDIKTLAWLENYLKHLSIPFLVISHDRKFLDNCINKIWELKQRTLRVFSGDYSFYKREKEIEYNLKLKSYEKSQKKITQLKRALNQRKNMAEKQEKFKPPRSVKKNGGKCKRDMYKVSQRSEGAMMKSAMALNTKVAKLIKTEEAKKPFVEKKRSIHIQEKNLRSRFVLKVKNMGKSFGEKQIFKNLSFAVENHAKLAIVGKNGCGKSTLLKILMGKIKKYDGDFVWNPQVRISYYSQEFENLNFENDIITEVTQNNYMLQSWARTVLGSLNITKDKVFQKISSLSIGERSKVVLTKIIISNSNVLVLDEPTNHLEISSREALEEALLKFNGTLIFVSHDRFLQEKLAEKKIDLTKFGGTNEL